MFWLTLVGFSIVLILLMIVLAVLQDIDQDLEQMMNDIQELNQEKESLRPPEQVASPVQSNVRFIAAPHNTSWLRSALGKFRRRRNSSYNSSD